MTLIWGPWLNFNSRIISNPEHSAIIIKISEDICQCDMIIILYDLQINGYIDEIVETITDEHRSHHIDMS